MWTQGDKKNSLYSDCGKLPFACSGQIIERWFSQTHFTVYYNESSHLSNYFGTLRN
jgi:hypothetical protein